ncbi:MAG: BON domain-containing protein [Pseudomonadota bacterium]
MAGAGQTFVVWGALALLLGGCAPAVVAGAASVGVASQQERGARSALSDAEINARLDTALLQADTRKYATLSTDVIEGRVTLFGALDDPEDAVEAEAIAWSVPGVTSVSNEIETTGTRSAAQILTDVRIANTARLQLLNNSSIEAFDYSITVINGTLHLTGIADTPAELERVTSLLRQVNGVERLISYVLLVDDPQRRTTAAPEA